MSRFNEVAAKILKVKPGKITDAASPATIASWDSFRGLLLITELEKQYRFKFSMDEVLSIRTIGDIKKIMQKHKIDPDAR